MVNNYVAQVCQTYSYKGIDDLVDEIIIDGFISVIDMKDVYRVIAIHPIDKPRQGKLCDLGTGPELLLDN